MHRQADGFTQQLRLSEQGFLFPFCVTFPNWLLLFTDFLVSWLCLLQRLAVITLAYSRKRIIRPRKLPRDFKWVFLQILSWHAGEMVFHSRGLHQQRFNSIICPFSAGRGHIMNLERCPVVISLQASQTRRTDPPIVSVIPSIRTFPNAPRSHSVSARKEIPRFPRWDTGHTRQWTI